jgi:hypothetical protein
MADGGGFYGSGFNNPRTPSIQTNWRDFNTKNNIAQPREPPRSAPTSKIPDCGKGNRGRNEFHRVHQFESTVDGSGGRFNQAGQLNTNDGYNNRNTNSSCNMSQAYGSHMTAGYPYANNTPHEQGQHEHLHNFTDSLPRPSQPMHPFGRMMFSATGNPMQSNSFLEAPPHFMPTQIFTDNMQPMPCPPPVYNIHNMCMPPPPLPHHNQMSHGNQPGLIQSGMMLPPNQIQQVMEQEPISISYSKSVDQEWVNRFLEERKQTYKEKQKRPKFKVYVL